MNNIAIGTYILPPERHLCFSLEEYAKFDTSTGDPGNYDVDLKITNCKLLLWPLIFFPKTNKSFSIYFGCLDENS